MTTKVYEGRARIELINGDCMEGMAGMQDKQFDLAIVDPPYGIGADNPSKKSAGVRQKNGRVLNVKLSSYPKKEWDRVPNKNYFKHLKIKSKNQIIWGCNYFDVQVGPGRIVWDKMNDDSNQFDCEIAYQSFGYDTRLVYYLWSGFMQGITASNKLSIAKQQTANKTLNEKRIHPTQKPVALYKWLLMNYAKPGDKIVDTHGGSMSLAIACWDLGFDLTCYELDKDYYDAAVKRFENHIKQKTLF